MQEQIKDIVSILFSFRIGKSWTQREIAKQLGVTPEYICMVEGGHRTPSFELLNRWAQLHGMKLYLQIGAATNL